MTVTLELEPDILEAARKEAEKQGSTPGDVMTEALRRRLAPLPTRKPQTVEEYRAVLAEMHELMKDAPVLPPDAFTRDSISDD